MKPLSVITWFDPDSLTDGYIGNEAEILAATHQRLGSTRIFSFGVGSSVNRFLIERMALFGNGAAAFIGLDDSAAEKVDLYYELIARPALTDVRIEWNGMSREDLYPRKIPDVFAGRPVTVIGRYDGEAQQGLRVTGKVGGEEVTYSVEADLPAPNAKHSAITSLWARWKIKDLMNEETIAASSRLKKKIIATSTKYNILSKYTAFLAVDSSEQTAGDHGVSLKVPVPIPEGVRYETTVSEQGELRVNSER